jgi:tRNA pseudouridine32 synthase/23S rRNA pseudouridine746 synthase
VQRYLAARTEWHEELRQGKMFGVLVVQTDGGALCYLAAFSGTLAGSNHHPFFVPPVYDLLRPDGFFRQEEERISALNQRLLRTAQSPEYLAQKALLTRLTQQADAELSAEKGRMKQSAARRAERRQAGNLSAAEEEAMIRQSQFEKAELRRHRLQWQAQTERAQADVQTWEEQIERLKEERKQRSAALQQQLFEQFRFRNFNGEVQTAVDIFRHTVHRTPPAGAGECAAPKLLQYASLHHLKPLCMAEFWWGNSPKSEVRHHGQYYPACKGKCEPILRHLLQGVTVEEADEQEGMPVLEVLYQDPALLVICKPAGMLSVPGKLRRPSVYTLACQRCPDAEALTMVHRLDMDTSGLMLIAKTRPVYLHLQRQFLLRTIKKRYVALLERPIAATADTIFPTEGIISLPLSPCLLDRPRQQVDEHGKEAITRYHILDQSGEYIRIALYPLTGRTHQLRLHTAHPRGLNAPIRGDRLYGFPADRLNNLPADRLYLHAEQIEFTHPTTGERMCIERKADF